MANTTKKTTKTKKVEEQIDTQITATHNENIVDKSAVTSVKKAEKKFERDEEILCTSVTIGGLTLIGTKSKDEYRWENYGDTAYVRYDDLQSLYTSKSPFITYPLFIIEDEDLVKQWGNVLGPIYNKILDQDLEAIFDLSPDVFRSRISNVPEGMAESIRTRAGQKIHEGSLYDIRIIKIIDEVLGTQFVELVI